MRYDEKECNVISFEIHEGYAYGISELLHEGIDTVIKLSPRINGYILIGAFTYDIIDGMALPDLRMLDDGDHSVFIHTNGEVIKADSISRDGRRIFLTPKGESAQRALRSELISLKKDLSNISREIQNIRDKIESSSVL